MNHNSCTYNGDHVGLLLKTGCIQNCLCQLIAPGELKAKQYESTIVLPSWTLETFLEVAWCQSYVYLQQLLQVVLPNGAKWIGGNNFLHQ